MTCKHMECSEYVRLRAENERLRTAWDDNVGVATKLRARAENERLTLLVKLRNEAVSSYSARVAELEAEKERLENWNLLRAQDIITLGQECSAIEAKTIERCAEVCDKHDKPLMAARIRALKPAGQPE